MVNRTTAIRPIDRQRLKDLAAALGGWPEVARRLGFRGSRTAHRWATADGATFKGRGYPQRIAALHAELCPATTPSRPAIEEMLEEVLDRLVEVERLGLAR